MNTVETQTVSSVVPNMRRASLRSAKAEHGLGPAQDSEEMESCAGSVEEKARNKCRGAVEENDRRDGLKRHR